MKTIVGFARPLSALALTCALLPIVACGSAPRRDDDVVGTESLAYDSVENPTLDGELEVGETSSGVLSGDARYHAFDFGVPARADVRVYTLPALEGGASVDTSIFLYKQGAHGFGSALTSSDDAHHTPWSEVTRTLEPGAYRVLVKGKTAAVRGAFRVGLDCPQCLETSACVFGATFNRVRRGQTVGVVRERVVTDASQLSTAEQLQLVDALHASSHTDVTTPEEALAAADSHEVNVLELWDATNGRAFVAFEYGAGDNSYGRIYPPASTTSVASIHDGDLEPCTVLPGRGGRDCRATPECGAGFTCEGASVNARRRRRHRTARATRARRISRGAALQGSSAAASRAAPRGCANRPGCAARLPTGTASPCLTTRPPG